MPSAGTLRLMRAIAATVFDRGQGVPPVRLDWMEEELRGFLGAAGLIPRMAVRFALLAVQWLPLLVIFRPRRFVSLPPAERMRYLVKMESHRLGLVCMPIMAVKIVLGSVYFEHPDAVGETGYDGGCLKGTVR